MAFDIIIDDPATYLAKSVWSPKSAGQAGDPAWANEVDDAIAALSNLLHGDEQVPVLDAAALSAETLVVTAEAKMRHVRCYSMLFHLTTSSMDERWYDANANASNQATATLGLAFMTPCAGQIIRVVFKFSADRTSTVHELYVNGASQATDTRAITANTTYTWDPSPITVAAGDHVHLSAEQEDTATVPQYGLAQIFVRENWDAYTLP